jgi:hypothetical protein
LIAAIIAALLLALAPVYAPANFLSGTGVADAGRTGVTIEFAVAARSASWPVAGDVVSFRVGTTGVKARDLNSLWVANKCSQDGVLVYAEYLPVSDSLAGPFLLSWGGGTASCTAYVWKFPASETPLRGASMTYTAF